MLDLLDDRASRLAHLIGVSSERIAQCREACHGPGVAPVYVVSLTPPAAICLVGPSTRLSPQGIAKPCPPGTFRVVVMAADGNAFADFPLPPIANITIE